MAGDVAPTGGDDMVDIADVVRALRASVGLDSLGEAELHDGDVSPARRAGELLIVTGNGILDVADVVLLLRAAVGLERLAWPERRLLATSR